MKLLRPACVLLLMASVLIPAPNAAAWGPKARLAIAQASLHMMQRKFDFRAGEISYEKDMFNGMVDGWESIGEALPMSTDAQSIDAIIYEIATLREAREHGVGSYFAYRMGNLAALVADVIQPYGIAYNPQDQKFKDLVDADIDKHVERYIFAPKTLQFRIISSNLYYNTHRPFYWGGRKLIADDYTRGMGYDGLLSEAGTSYYQRSIQVVVDAWYSVLSDSTPSRVTPSPRAMAEYYIKEIEYLLTERKTIEFTERAYELFSEYNPGLPEAHITIGDHFYQYDTPQAKERGVEEWKIAQQIPGVQRQQASQRLSNHFIDEGDTLYLRARSPEGIESDYADSLRSFQLAMEYDRTNELAAERIHETTKTITERKELYSVQQIFIDTAMAIVKDAEKSRLNKDYGSTLSQYTQAIGMLELVTGDFRDLQLISKESVSSIRKEQKGVISEVLDTASINLEEGDNFQFSNQYEQAIQAYNRAVVTVNVIPAAEGSINFRRKQDIIDTAQGAIADSNVAKKRDEDNKKAAAAAPIQLR